MKTPDVTKPVMEKVVRFERRRTAAWFIRYRTVVITAVLLFLLSVGVVVKILSDQQSFALLSLFRQDPEIITSYWKDTVWVFWEEVPQGTLLIAAVLFISIIIGVVATGRKRKILHTKLKKLANHL